MRDKSNKVLSETIRKAFVNMAKELHTSIPAEVISFDPLKQTAELQPTIKRLYSTLDADGNETEQYIAIPKLINVPIMFPRAGGWCITFPVTKGDEVLVHFSERAIDEWRKKGGVQDVPYWRLHSYSDAIGVIGLCSEPRVIEKFDKENFQIRNEDNDVSITMNTGKIVEIKSPVEVIFDVPLVTFTGNTKVDGNTDIDGNLTTVGTSTASDHISDGISGKGHSHPYSWTDPGGSSSTGTPQ